MTGGPLIVSSPLITFQQKTVHVRLVQESTAGHLASMSAIRPCSQHSVTLSAS